MRMRLGLAAGFAAGYYLGAKAGRERYEELQQLLAKVKRSDVYSAATDKAKAAVDLGVERAREVVDEHKPGNGSSPATDLDLDEEAATVPPGVVLSGTPGTPPSGTGREHTPTTGPASGSMPATPATPDQPDTAIP